MNDKVIFDINYGLAPLLEGILTIIYNMTITPMYLQLLMISFATGFFLVIFANFFASLIASKGWKKEIKNE